MCLEGEYLSAYSRKMNEGVLHGGKQKAGRAAWTKELADLHVEVDEAGDCWANCSRRSRSRTTGRPFRTPPRNESLLLPNRVST